MNSEQLKRAAQGLMADGQELELLKLYALINIAKSLEEIAAEMATIKEGEGGGDE